MTATTAHSRGCQGEVITCLGLLCAAGVFWIGLTTRTSYDTVAVSYGDPGLHFPVGSMTSFDRQ